MEKENQSREEFVREAIGAEGSKPLEGGLTNDLVRTYAGTVLKEFGSRPKMSYVQAGGRVPAGTIERQGTEDRIENEEVFRDFIADYDIKVPELLGTVGRYAEFEAIDGEDLDRILRESSEKAEEYGREIGAFLDYVHGNDGAVTDLRVNNFMVEDEELVFLDAEYFVEGANSWEKKMDLITLNNSLRQVDQTSYHAFREGFQEVYGEDFSLDEDAAVSVLSPLHAAVLERDTERLTNSFSNLEYTLNRYL